MSRRYAGSARGVRRTVATLALAAAVAASAACSSDPGLPASAPLTAGQSATGPSGAVPAGQTPDADSPTGSGAPAAAPSAKQDPRLEAATGTVSRFYSAYLAAPGKQTAAGYLGPQLLAALFTQQRDVDRVICAHALPTAVRAAPGAIKGQNVTVSVTTTQQGVDLPPIVVTVRASDQRIVQIACSG